MRFNNMLAVVVAAMAMVVVVVVAMAVFGVRFVNPRSPELMTRTWETKKRLLTLKCFPRNLLWYFKTIILCTKVNCSTTTVTDTINVTTVLLVIILGDSGVGKSNLLLRWNTDSFADLPPTLQVEFYTKSFMVDGKIICGQFWDTAGQEKYRSLTRQYYNGANGVVIMYSVTDLPSFVSVAKWLTDLRNINEDAKVIIVGNKIDLNGKLRKIRDYGQEYAKSVQIPFLEISAKEGTNSMKALQLILQCIHVKDEIKEVEQEKVKPIDFTNFDSDDEIDDFGDKCTGCHVEPDNIW
eukprot:TRINITY_DN7424_c0_g1_i2.p1 TRINITY_DN7424_c0_g1~~TRINITY_DN7424_c0_g1_i2.p1  ORF type:complete len:295 (-),score=46.14 TRINITY_DN7424_c0_g1_i2:231-1115(-)